MSRLRFISFIIFFIFFIVWIRLFYWQIVSHDRLKTLADKQHLMTLEIPAFRGEILSNDHSLLVTNQKAYLVFVEKKFVENKTDYVTKLAPIIEEEEASISARFDTYEGWVPIAHQIDQEKVDKIKRLSLKGIGFEREDRRFYPESSMSAHLLGFVGKDELGRPKGYFGLEGYYDKELSGVSGLLLQEKDAMGNPIVIGKHEKIKPEDGRTLVLYLDKTIQFIAETKLKKALNRYGAKEGSVTILDPKTGGILAMASYPNYDPYTFYDYPKIYYKNPIIANTYEPGSTFKPLIMAEALDKKKLTPSDSFYEKGPLTVSGYKIRTWNNEYHGNISLSEILQYSSNVGMVYVQSKLGKENTWSFLNQAGFGKKTGIDLQEETSSVLRDKSQWHDIDYATVSFGQGIAVTPIQMISAIAAIANNGVLMEPHVVKEIISSSGNSIVIHPKKVKRIFKSSTASIITQFMVDAVEKGEAKWAVPKGYRIAGKTGTAQIPVEGHYDKDKTIASFVGFAPSDNPRFVMLVLLKEPTSSPWGSETAAPLFFDIAKEIFAYMGIAPE